MCKLRTLKNPWQLKIEKSRPVKAAVRAKLTPPCAGWYFRAKMASAPGQHRDLCEQVAFVPMAASAMICIPHAPTEEELIAQNGCHRQRAYYPNIT